MLNDIGCLRRDMSRCIHSVLTLLALTLLAGGIPSAALAEGKSSVQSIEQMIRNARLAALADEKLQTVRFPSVKGEKIELIGHLRRPDGAGPFRAVVLLHGCAGDWPGMDSRWGRRLANWGYVALSVESFGPRGIRSACGGGDPRDHVFDTYGALSFLAAQPFVVPGRIALMGVSLGGIMVLRDVERGGVERMFRRKFRAAVALYPQCSGITGTMTVPTLILIGQLDDLTFAKNCQDLASGNPLGASRSGPKDENIRLTVLPGAYHAFDDTMFPTGKRFLGHWLEYNPDATKRSVSEIRQFLRDNLGD
jgi:dienelactone hydrolase